MFMNLILIIYKMTENKMTKIKTELKLYDRVKFVNFIKKFTFFNHLVKADFIQTFCIFFQKVHKILKPHNITEKKLLYNFYLRFYNLFFFSFSFFA